MEPLAYVEVIGRSGEVHSRHPVYRWPACVGRGYKADVIVDDAHVAPLHVRIEVGEDGRFCVHDLGSINGTMLAAGGERVSETHIGPDDVLVLGQTQLRVRPLHYAVRAETPLRTQTSWREISLFALLSAVVVGVVMWNAHLVTLHQEETPVLVFGALTSMASIALWVSAWTLLSRIVTGRGSFAAHGVIACAAMILLVIVDVVFDYLAFGLDTGALEYAGLVAAALVFAYAFYRHLRLASRASTRSLGIAAALVSVTLYAGTIVLEQVRESTNHARQRYSETVKAPVFLLAKGVTPAAMLTDADNLRRKVDEEAKKEP
jgi:hypothetical protein